MESSIQSPGIEEWKVLSNFVAIRRCTSAVVEEVDGELFYWRDNVVVPQYVGDASNAGIILGVGPDCKEIQPEHIGAKVWCPEYVEGLHRISGEDFVIREDKLLPWMETETGDDNAID